MLRSQMNLAAMFHPCTTLAPLLQAAGHRLAHLMHGSMWHPEGICPIRSSERKSMIRRCKSKGFGTGQSSLLVVVLS